MAVNPRLPFRTVLISQTISQRDGGVLRWGKQSCQGPGVCLPSVTQTCKLWGHSPLHLSSIEMPELGGAHRKAGGDTNKKSSPPPSQVEKQVLYSKAEQASFLPHGSLLARDPDPLVQLR